MVLRRSLYVPRRGGLVFYGYNSSTPVIKSRTFTYLPFTDYSIYDESKLSVNSDGFLVANTDEKYLIISSVRFDDFEPTESISHIDVYNGINIGTFDNEKESELGVWNVVFSRNSSSYSLISSIVNGDLIRTKVYVDGVDLAISSYSLSVIKLF